MNLRSIKEVDVAGKRVLLRADLNEPIANGEVQNSFRLKRALATIEYLAFRGARIIIIIAHLGRHGDTLAPVFEKLQSLTSVPMQFCTASPSEAASAAQSLQEGGALLLENIRRESGEETNNPELVKILASLGDLYVDDAFADAHRAHASIVGVPALLPSYAGLLMEEEVAHLSQALTPPQGALAILGGAKFETKEPLIRKLLELYETVCVGGALANDFLKAKGCGVGASLTSEAVVAPELLARPALRLPLDVLVLKGDTTRLTTVEHIAEGEQIVDAGEETTAAWSEAVRKSSFVLWNGPLGVYEDGRVKATDAIAEAIAQSGVRAAVGGGDTLAALEKISFNDSLVFRSTGGGAMLQFLADGTLPGLVPLEVK